MGLIIILPLPLRLTVFADHGQMRLSLMVRAWDVRTDHDQRHCGNGTKATAKRIISMVPPAWSHAAAPCLQPARLSMQPSTILPNTVSAAVQFLHRIATKYIKRITGGQLLMGSYCLLGVVDSPNLCPPFPAAARCGPSCFCVPPTAQYLAGILLNASALLLRFVIPRLGQIMSG